MGASTNGRPITPYLNSWAYTLEADREGYHYYRCFHAKGTIDVRAPSVLDARDQAAQHWRLGKRAHEISTVLYAKWDASTRAPAPVSISTASL